MEKVPIKVYSYTETSRKNIDENEDSHYSYYNGNLNIAVLLVCDGLGGAPGGRTASHTIRDIFKENFSDEILSKIPDMSEDEIKVFIRNNVEKVLTLSRDKLKEEFIKENEQRVKENKTLLPEKHKRGGFSSTFSCVIIYNQTAYYTWVGDSRIYILRKGRLRPLSFDHSEGIGKENFNELEMVLSGKVMSKCVSPFADDEFLSINENEIFTFDLKYGDLIFAASDGIFDYLLPWTLEMVFVKTLAFGFPLEEYIKKIYYQIRLIFQDDTTIAAAFIGKVKPFGERFPYLDDAFFYLNMNSFNSKIENEFNKYPTNWDDIDAGKHWKEYSERKPWMVILKDVKKLTKAQVIPDKVICQCCNSSLLLTDNSEGVVCSTSDCKGEIYKGPFLEIYMKYNTCYDNPYKTLTYIMDKGKGNMYVINNKGIDNADDKCIDFSHFKDTLVIKDIDDIWEINIFEKESDVEFYVFHPEIINNNSVEFKNIKSIILGENEFEFIYPYKENEKKFKFNDEVYKLKDDVVYIYGRKILEDIKDELEDKNLEYLEVTGDYVDNFSGVILKNKKTGKLCFQDAKWDNGLFINTGNNFIRTNGYPENLILRIGRYYVAFRGKRQNIKSDK